MYGDAAMIRRLARQVAEQAADIRTHADELVRASELVVWEGRAATAMRERMAERAVALRKTADQHDDAADALRHHAAEVERLKDLITDIANRVAGLVEGARSRLTGRAIDPASNGIPDPIDELLAGFSPPPEGHKDWLDVPDSLPGISR